MFFFCKQKTAYEMRISDWSSDVCSSDLVVADVEIDQIECRPHQVARAQFRQLQRVRQRLHRYVAEFAMTMAGEQQLLQLIGRMREIGRASCRERGCQYV